MINSCTFEKKVMEIVMSNKMIQPAVRKPVEEGINLIKELQSFFKKKQVTFSDEDIEVNGDQIILNNISPMHLHSFSLYLESKGRELEFEKKTILRVR